MRTIPDEGGRCIVRCQEAESRAVPAIDIPERGVADADGILKHCVKRALQIAWRIADDLKDLRRSGLLLQGLV